MWQADWRYWPLFERHHYPNLPRTVAATNYVRWIIGAPVAYLDRCHI